MIRAFKIIISCILITGIFAASCVTTTSASTDDRSSTSDAVVVPVIVYIPITVEKEDTDVPVTDVKPFSEEEFQMIAQTLAGECYDDKHADKRKVAEVIVNRVSDGAFGDTIVDVVTKPGQFCGYKNQLRELSDSDILITEEVLTDWYNNNQEALSEYLFFTAGDNRENVFRSEY